MLRAKLLDRNDPIQRDYCSQRKFFNIKKNHRQLFKLLPVASDFNETPIKPETKALEPVKPPPEKFGQCDCNTCTQTCQKDQKEGDEQRQV